VKKAMVAGGFFCFFFLSLWFSSLELTINSEMVVFFMLKVVMAKGRRLKKGGVEVHKQNVVLSNQAIVKECCFMKPSNC
jgi:hypothetical protein